MRTTGNLVGVPLLAALSAEPTGPFDPEGASLVELVLLRDDWAVGRAILARARTRGTTARVFALLSFSFALAFTFAFAFLALRVTLGGQCSLARVAIGELFSGTICSFTLDFELPQNGLVKELVSLLLRRQSAIRRNVRFELGRLGQLIDVQRQIGLDTEVGFEPRQHIVDVELKGTHLVVSKPCELAKIAHVVDCTRLHVRAMIMMDHQQELPPFWRLSKFVLSTYEGVHLAGELTGDDGEDRVGQLNVDHGKALRVSKLFHCCPFLVHLKCPPKNLVSLLWASPSESSTDLIGPCLVLRSFRVVRQLKFLGLAAITTRVTTMA